MIEIIIAFLKPAWNLAKTSIPIPLGIIAALALWLHFDKTTAVRKAVNAYAIELVAGAEIAAAKADAQAMQEIAAAQRKVIAAGQERALADAAARQSLEQQIVKSDDINAQLQADIDDILSTPQGNDCTVGDGLFKRLRNH